MRFLLILAMFALLLFPISCGDDDDDDNDDSSTTDDDSSDDDSDVDDDDDNNDNDDDNDDTVPTDYLTLDSGIITVHIWKNPFGVEVLDDAKGIVTQSLKYSQANSVSYVRGTKRHQLAAFQGFEEISDGFILNYSTTEGETAELTVALATETSVQVDFSLSKTDGFLWATQDMQLIIDEAIYGAVERIHWFYDFAEGNPREIGTLNRRGQWHPMVVQGTIGAYTPFYQSSQGYGLYVDTTFYGLFDFGRTNPDRLRFTFNTAEGNDPILSYTIFYGPGHDEIIDQYWDVTGRPFIPPLWSFLHWRWRDTHAKVFDTLDGNIVNGELAEDVEKYDDLNIPVGNYMIDRPYTPGELGWAEFSWDPDRFPNPDKMIESLFDRGYHLIVWGAPWAIGFDPGQNGYEADLYGYHAPNQQKHIDFTNPDAVDWFSAKITQFVTDWGIHGWKLDRGDEDPPSLWWEIYWDGRSGAEIRNEYPLLYQKTYFDAMQDAWGDDFVMIARTSWAGTQKYSVIWGGDTRGGVGNNHDTPTDLGLRSAILSQLHCAFMGLPLWTSDTGGYWEFRDRDTFARWIEFSAFSPLMEIGGVGTHAPWNMPTSPSYDTEMIDIYRTYTQLHHDLVEYIRDYSLGESGEGRTVVRPLVFDHPDDPNVIEMWDEYYLGEDILVAPIWEVGVTQRDVYIPAGQFVEYWNPGTTITGPTTVTANAPLDRIPFYIRKGTEILGQVW
jgi:alpha-D-xyloside xylohydrolase